MSRRAERYARKTSSVTSGVGREPRPAEAVGGRLSADTGRRQLEAAGAGSRFNLTDERHDWLVRVELP
jgi:hypothetical protein